MNRAFPAFFLLAITILSGCDERTEKPLAVSVIGGQPTIIDPNRAALSPTQRLLLPAIAQGLVGFDAAGQIEPALAERWIVTDDGLSYIFRFGPNRASDGKPITTAEIAKRLRGAIGRKSRNPMKAGLEAIEEINAITPDVLEIRLSTPRPPLLHLLAQPELAVVDGGGTGPYRAGPIGGRGVVTLTPMMAAGEDPPTRADRVILRGDRAAASIARFVNGDVDLVLGGGLYDLPLVRAAGVARRALRFDPAEGLFGLAIIGGSPFLDDPDNRRSLAMAIDRQGLVDLFAVPGWQQALAVLPERYRSSADPAVPGWSILTIGQRQATARTTVDAWHANAGAPPVLRIALPPSPGARLLFARIAADWSRIGVRAVQVGPDDDADLRLIDRVAPAPSAIWYLSLLACVSPALCDTAAVDAIAKARSAKTLAERGQALAEADQAISGGARFILLARPLRWSLVAPDLNQYRDNPRAAHPLAHLRGPAS